MQQVHFARITVLLSRKVSSLPMEESSGKYLQIPIRYFLFTIVRSPWHGGILICWTNPIFD